MSMFISGNNHGVRIEGGTTGNVVAGNYIGTKANGTEALGNTFSGVTIQGSASSNTIGGTTASARNVISGNNTNGVEILSSGTTGNVVVGNYIGTKANGTEALGNSSDGVLISGGASSNTIGGTASGAGNVIAFNSADGVVLTANAGTGNAIERNSIFENTDLGIDLNDDGVTANDPGDADSSPNKLQNFPSFSAAIDGAGDLVVTYRVDTDPANATYPLSVEFFEADADNEEGKTFLSSDAFTTGDHNGCGSAPCFKTVTLGNAASFGVSLGDFLVTTATDADGNTSEFSSAIDVLAQGNLVVNTTDDNLTAGDGLCTLREAITNANQNGDTTSWDCAAGSAAMTDMIVFDIPGGGVKTIQPTSALPTITEAVTIDGYTQTGASANTLSVGNNAVLLIELDGSLAGSVIGLTIIGSNSTIRGLVINRFGGDGIRVTGAGATGNTIEGNFIGTDTGGTANLGNIEGVRIESSASSNTIGGTTASARNVISGNTFQGVLIAGSGVTGNVVAGNYIGTDKNGTADLGNIQHGVNIISASSNTIGGTASGAGNVISGNNGRGVLIQGSDDNVVEGNYIGTDVNGTANLGNTQDGVRIENSAASNTIGGTASGAGNIIAFNGEDGIALAASAGTGNAIERNSIFENTQLGIDLSNNGVTANDANDPDTGPNNLQNFPTITAAVISGGDLIVTYSVDSTPTTNAAYPIAVEIFEADTDDQEGKTFLGSDSYASGNHPSTNQVNLGNAAALGVSVGDKLVATTTDNDGNTSEFTASVTVQLAGTLVVNTTADNTTAGDTNCTLREAITNANNNNDTTSGDCAPGAASVTDMIEFNISGGGVKTIQPTSALPTITGAVEIDGYTQSGASANTLAVGNNAVLLIELDGTSAGSVIGLTITGSNSTIRGLVINRFGGDGIRVTGAGATGNTIEGNFIGTDTGGTVNLGNIEGVRIESSASSNTIGGTTASARNVISGNTFQGVLIAGSGVTGNVVAGNYIGTDKNGTANLGNTQDGVRIENSAASNTIGGTASGAGNIIAFNGEDGIALAASAGTGNAIERNSIFENTQLGIDLSNNGVTANDTNDPDTGPNNFQNFPTITAAVISGGDLLVTYSVDSTPTTNAAYPLAVEIFEADTDDQEGKTFLGSDSYASGEYPGTVQVNLGNAAALGVSVGDKLVATATDANGNTSEFTASFTVTL